MGDTCGRLGRGGASSCVGSASLPLIDADLPFRHLANRDPEDSFSGEIDEGTLDRTGERGVGGAR